MARLQVSQRGARAAGRFSGHPGDRLRASQEKRAKKKPALRRGFYNFDFLSSAATNDGRSARARRRALARRGRNQPLADGILPRCLARTANGFALLAHALFRRLFVIAAELHFTEHALALKTLLQHAERLIDIVVANENLQELS